MRDWGTGMSPLRYLSVLICAIRGLFPFAFLACFARGHSSMLDAGMNRRE